MRHEFTDGEETITIVTYETLTECVAECRTNDPDVTADVIRDHHKCWGFARVVEGEIHCWLGDANVADIVFLLAHEFAHHEPLADCMDAEELCNSYGAAAVRAYETALVLVKDRGPAA